MTHYRPAPVFINGSKNEKCGRLFLGCDRSLNVFAFLVSLFETRAFAIIVILRAVIVLVCHVGSFAGFDFCEMHSGFDFH